MPVTPKTSVYHLATALASEERKHGGAALALNASNDDVLALAAKALATLPHVARPSDEEPSNEGTSNAVADKSANSDHGAPEAVRGLDLACVLRWPQSRGATRIYAHIVHRGKLTT
eukprot:TRINITY_DN66021_c0_g1_i1.p1 TRINITY_DN66021_c0_g1~~TRINITY_DN66021_c0_g1_i1.p1  ORF type:complete len:116 (-),score=22.63 TRINITY_DN66021_c0_g1_i1:208-555(-)